VHRRGVERAGACAVIGDGAAWVQSFGDWHCPGAVRILDLPHAAERIYALCARGAPGAEERGRARGEELVRQLKEEGPEGVLAVLREIVVHLGEAAHERMGAGERTAAGDLEYLEKRKEQMQYPRFAASGWPLGSGMVESAHKQVMQERMKGPGMRWARPNVNPVLALRNGWGNERWEEMWERLTDQRRQSRAAHRRARAKDRVPAPRAVSVAPLQPPPGAAPSRQRAGHHPTLHRHALLIVPPPIIPGGARISARPTAAQNSDAHPRANASRCQGPCRGSPGPSRHGGAWL
jgi:hypothetical protein